MEKRAFGFHLAAELSPDEFAAVFLGDYASVVQKHQPGICRFSLDLPLRSQQKLIDTGVEEDRIPPFSGLMMSWYQTLQDAVEPGRLYATPDSAHIVADVVGTFLGGLEALRLDEHPVWDDTPKDTVTIPTSRVKQIFFVTRHPDITPLEFRSRYGRYGDMARENHPGIEKYVQNLVIEAQGEWIGNIDAVSEIWYRSMEDLREHFYLRSRGNGNGPDSACDFIDFSALCSVLVTEHVIY